MIPLWLKLAGAGIVLAALAGLYWRYEYLVTTVATQKVALEANQREVARLGQQIQDVSKAISGLNTAMDVARTEVQEVRTSLAKHDLGKLAASKPGLVTRAMRRGTVRIFKELENTANETASKP